MCIRDSGKAINDATYQHKPGSSGLSKFLCELEQLRNMQQFVEFKPGGCIDFDELTVRAHNCIHQGVGGRTESVQELHTKWEAQLPKNCPGTVKWNNFKTCHAMKLWEYDNANLITSKSKRANSIISPHQSAINQQTTNHLAEPHDDIATVRDEMQSVVREEMQSVMSAPQSRPNVPSIIPAETAQNNSNTSAITLDRTHREMMEQRNRAERLESAIEDLKRQLASERSTAPTVSSGSTTTRTPDIRIKHTDDKGQHWFQIAHCCSRHGCNHHHDNAGCRDKQAPIRKDWQKQWQAGATHTDHKNGSNHNQDKCSHWIHPSTNQCSPVQPL